VGSHARTRTHWCGTVHRDRMRRHARRLCALRPRSSVRSVPFHFPRSNMKHATENTQHATYRTQHDTICPSCSLQQAACVARPPYNRFDAPRARPAIPRILAVLLRRTLRRARVSTRQPACYAYHKQPAPRTDACTGTLAHASGPHPESTRGCGRVSARMWPVWPTSQHVWRCAALRCTAYSSYPA
jgi:hypothetical protein